LFSNPNLKAFKPILKEKRVSGLRKVLELEFKRAMG
jgi:hypothetical protein